MEKCFSAVIGTSRLEKCRAAIAAAVLAAGMIGQHQAAAVSTADPLPAREMHNVEIYKRLSAAVVGIRARNPKGGPGAGYFGTGVVIDPGGLILTTTTTVPSWAADVKIYFTDGRILPASIVETSDQTEASLIKVEGKDFVHMKLADSRKYKAGDTVYSWGNPYLTIERDGQVSLSMGAISGIYRMYSFDDQSRYEGPAIETDAAINPGSDGGPLTDVEGNLLGILSLAYSRSRWLGIAVPSWEISQSLKALKDARFAPPPDTRRHPAGVMEEGIAAASRRVGEAVVRIKVAREGDKPPPPFGPAVNRPRNEVARMEAARPVGAGCSGVVLDAGGLVLTCAYNVEGKTTSIEVTTASGEKYPAEVLGAAEVGDIALLKVELPPGKTLPKPPKFGPAERHKVGAVVAVLGRSEEDLSLTLNAGIVSAVRRLDGTAIQTDALVNYGNLGGPAINLDGEVIGIAAHLSEKSHWRQNCGVSLITKWEAISAALPDLKAGKSIPAPKKPFLGVSPEFGALDIRGVKVQRVIPDSPAANAGIKEGDIIVALGASKIESWNDLLEAIRKTKGGEQISVRIRRGEGEVTLTVTMGEK